MSCLQASGNSIGAFSLTPNAFPTDTFTTYDEMGNIISQVSRADNNYSTNFSVAQTDYVDQAAFSNAVSRLLPNGLSIVQENFNSPSYVTITNNLISYSCYPGTTCSSPPPAMLPLTASADGSSLSGQTGLCEFPNCNFGTNGINGYQVWYEIDLHSD